MSHIGLSEHDGYAAHSHEVRPDHLGVASDRAAEPASDMEWLISHMRGLEIAVDEIMFALNAGGYAPRDAP